MPGVRAALRAYRVKGKYGYYACKNPDTACRILLPQPTLVRQLPGLLAGIALGAAERDSLRQHLLQRVRERSGDDRAQRRQMEAEYAAVRKEIGDVVAQRPAAAALGIVDVVDQRLAALKARKDGLQARLNTAHDRGTEWVEGSSGVSN